MKRYLFLLLFFVPTLVFGSNTAQVSNVSNSSRIYKTSFYLYSGRQYEFRTESSSDTVLHLMYSSNYQVAYNDDCGSNCSGTQGNLNSTIIYTPSSSGYYNLMVRHYQSGVVGAVTDIKEYENGSLKWSTTNRPVGGYKITIDSWDAYYQSTPIMAYRYLNFYYLNRSKEDVGGADSPDTVMYLMSGYTTVTDFDDDGGASYSSKIRKTSGSCSSGCKILGGAYPYSSASEGNAKLLVDVEEQLHDLDWDGLSAPLETLLGTSNSSSDTDNDGLSDYLEAVGSGSVALPWEGSNPTVEDIFIEVDYMPVSTTRYPGAQFTDYYPAARTFFMQGNQGIDITAEMKYAFSHHDNTRLHIDVDDQIPRHDTMRCTGSDSGIDDINMDTLYNNYFTASRAGIYRYIVFGDSFELSGDPSPGTGGSVVGMSCGNGRMMVALRPFQNYKNAYPMVTLHELGHDLSLTHNGNDDTPSYCDHNSRIHRSVMNYYYVSAFDKVPKIYANDSHFRYATDAPGTYANPYEQAPIDDYDGTYGVNWDVVWASGSTDGCVTPTDVSTKQACLDNPNDADCDCTFNAYTSGRIDYSGGGAIMGDAVLGEFTEKLANLSQEEQSQIMENRVPVVGVDGQVVASNLKTLLSSGERVRKGLTKERKIVVQERDIKKLLGESVVDRYNKLLQEKLRKRSDWKEGKNYFVNEKSGKVEFNGSKYGYRESK